MVGAGEILGLVGESGSGKTTTALALLGYTRPGVVIAQREVEVGGEQILGRDAPRCAACAGASSRTCRRIRAARSTRRCAIGDAILDVLRAHRAGDGSASRCTPRSRGSSSAPTALRAPLSRISSPVASSSG